MNSVHLLLGANLGKPIEQLDKARQQIEEHIGHIVRQSALYESEAWGLEDQPHFYNQVLLVDTRHNALDTLRICQEIEARLGRVRHKKWGARVMDIDLLYFNDDIIDTDSLRVPHPYLHLRRFTLLPLSEIDAQYVHPILKKTTTELLQDCTDELSVVKL